MLNVNRLKLIFVFGVSFLRLIEGTNSIIIRCRLWYRHLMQYQDVGQLNHTQRLPSRLFHATFAACVMQSLAKYEQPVRALGSKTIQEMLKELE